MKTVFVDTNLFIRYFTNDDPVKADKVEKLLDDAREGSVQLVTAEMVMAETVWVLESSYGLTNKQIAPLIRSILATPGLEVINSALVSRALQHYEEANIDFIDGYIAAVMEKNNIPELYSFDKKHMRRVKSIKRLEP